MAKKDPKTSIDIKPLRYQWGRTSIGFIGTAHIHESISFVVDSKDPERLNYIHKQIDDALDDVGGKIHLLLAEKCEEFSDRPAPDSARALYDLMVQQQRAMMESVQAQAQAMFELATITPKAIFKWCKNRRQNAPCWWRFGHKYKSTTAWSEECEKCGQQVLFGTYMGWL